MVAIKVLFAFCVFVLLSMQGDAAQDLQDETSPVEENSRPIRSLRRHHVKHWIRKPTHIKHWLRKPKHVKHWIRKTKHIKHGITKPKHIKHGIVKVVHPKLWKPVLPKIHPEDWLKTVGAGFKYSAIYPGTNWCGDGNIAKDWSDLGRKWRPDVCCRDHDVCEYNVKAGETKYGIHNDGSFTISHCDCDMRFYQCLKNSHSTDSNIIGVTYFDLLNNYCIYQDYPTVCKTGWDGKNKCWKKGTGQGVWQKKKIGLTYFGHH